MGENQHIDLETLSTLKEVMEDEFQVLIDTFTKDSQQRIAMLKEAIESNDAHALRTAAHSFKGSCGNIGAPHLADLCCQLEQKGLQQQLDGAEQTLLQIQQEFTVVSQSLAEL